MLNIGNQLLLVSDEELMVKRFKRKTNDPSSETKGSR